MRFVDADEIRRVLTFPKLIAGMEAAHRRPKIDVVDASLGNEAGHYFVRHAVDPGRLMASKMFTSFPQNLAKNLPAVQAVCVVFDGTNGTPLAVLDGTEITYWRTAADSVVPDQQPRESIGAESVPRRRSTVPTTRSPPSVQSSLWQSAPRHVVNSRSTLGGS